MCDGEYLDGYESGRNDAADVIWRIMKSYGLPTKEIKENFKNYFDHSFVNKCKGCDEHLYETWEEFCDECKKVIV